MKREFRNFIQMAVSNMEGGDWFDMVIEYLVGGVEVNPMDIAEIMSNWLCYGLCMVQRFSCHLKIHFTFYYR